jgi:hypothetical protein
MEDFPFFKKNRVLLKYKYGVVKENDKKMRGKVEKIYR